MKWFKKENEMIKDILNKAIMLRKLTEKEIEWWYSQADKKALERQQKEYYTAGNLHNLEEWLKYNEKDIEWLKSKLYEKNITYNDAHSYEESTKFMENGVFLIPESKSCFVSDSIQTYELIKEEEKKNKELVYWSLIDRHTHINKFLHMVEWDYQKVWTYNIDEHYMNAKIHGWDDYWVLSYKTRILEKSMIDAIVEDAFICVDSGMNKTNRYKTTLVLEHIIWKNFPLQVEVVYDEAIEKYNVVIFDSVVTSYKKEKNANDLKKQIEKILDYLTK